MESERNGGYFAGGWVGAHPVAGEVSAVLWEGVTYVTRDELHRWWLLDRALELLRTPKPKRGRGQRRNRRRACTRSNPCAGCVAKARARNEAARRELVALLGDGLRWFATHVLPDRDFDEFAGHWRAASTCPSHRDHT